MDSFIAKMDSMVTNEKGHASLNAAGVENNRVAFFAKLMRGISKENINEFLMMCLKDINNLSQNGNSQEAFSYFQDIIVMMVQTRDIINGKGERKAFYDFFMSFFDYFPETAISIIPCIPMIYGSWLDMNNLWLEIKSKNDHKYDNLEKIIIKSWSVQLQEDFKNLEMGQDITLAAKWAPRVLVKKNKKGEKKPLSFRNKHLNNLATKIALDIFTDSDEKVDERHRWNCLKKYRQMCSWMNSQGLRTVETFMCNPNKIWDKINPSTVPAKALKVYRLAFQNLPSKFQQKKDHNLSVRSQSADRIKCATNFTTSSSLHGARLQIHELVKQVIENDDDLITQKQFNDIMMKCFFGEDNDEGYLNHLENAIIMCDSSSSMNYSGSRVKPMFAAIGLSEIASQLTKPPFKNRVLTFSTDPEWVTLPETTYTSPYFTEKKIQEIKRDEWKQEISVKSGSFRDRVLKILNSNWSGTTNFYKAMELILKSCLEANLGPNEIEKLTLFIFSDMQFDNSLNYNSSWNHEYQCIKEMFTKAGLESSHRSPFPVPFIVFWNLNGNTVSNPVKGHQEGVAYISGFSQSGFKGFMDGSLTSIRSQPDTPRPSPWDIYRVTMDNLRYDPIREICQENISEFNKKYKNKGDIWTI